MPVPLVVRTPSGGRRGYGPTHSQSPEHLFTAVPGLTVVFGSHRHDIGRLLIDAVLRWRYPVALPRAQAALRRDAGRGGLRRAAGQRRRRRGRISSRRCVAAPTIRTSRWSPTAACCRSWRQRPRRLAEEEELAVEIVAPSLLAPLPRAIADRSSRGPRARRHRRRIAPRFRRGRRDRRRHARVPASGDAAAHRHATGADRLGAQPGAASFPTRTASSTEFSICSDPERIVMASPAHRSPREHQRRGRADRRASTSSEGRFRQVAATSSAPSRPTSRWSTSSPSATATCSRSCAARAEGPRRLRVALARGRAGRDGAGGRSDAASRGARAAGQPTAKARAMLKELDVDAARDSRHAAIG